MPVFNPTVRRSLADRLHALRSDLDSLGNQLRAEIAASVGKAIAGAVTDAVHNVLGGGRRAPPVAPPACRTWPPEPARPYWDRPTGRDYDAWSAPPDDPWSADRYEPDRDEERDDDPAPSPPTTPRLRSWVAALCAGCRAAWWWLRRQQGKGRLLTTLAVGLVAGLVTLAAGPVATATASAVGAVVGLTALSDAARSTAGDLAGAFSP